ncbi:MAG: hypothetical protein ACR2KI_08890 [Candidatus Limnocylindria bacterium]
MEPEQLPLTIPGGGSPRRLPSRISPMQPVAVDEPFDDAGYLFEPWWPGIRAIVFAEHGRLRMQVSGLADALAAFPELAAIPAELREDGVVLDGSLVVLDASGRPDPELLRARLSGARRGGAPAYVASDLLWSAGRSWTRRSFAARRRELGEVLPGAGRAIVGRGYPSEGHLVADALAALGIDGLSARRLDARYRAGEAGESWLRAPITPRVRERPALALILRLPLHPE